MGQELKKVLIIGSEENSAPCIQALQEKGIQCETNIDCILHSDIFDYIIITDKKDADKIIQILTEELYISEDKIMDFWKVYKAFLPTMVCDRVMLNQKISEYEGIILGISHTEVGIIAEQLKVPFCNLAVSSQDIYYQWRTLQYCLEQYPEKLKNLKYAIIDFYDYRYFNYDVSLSRILVSYLKYGGYNKDPHNFANNKNFDRDYAYYVDYVKKQAMEKVKDSEIKLWMELFSEVYVYADYVGFSGQFDISKRTRVVTEEDMEEYIYDAGSIRTIFPETMKENLIYMRKLLDTLKSINPQIKLYAVIIPKYIETEKRLSDGMAKFLPFYQKFMKAFQQEYQMVMLDFNQISNISEKRELYYDAAHLNCYGAAYLTEQLNKLMFEV